MLCKCNCNKQPALSPTLFAFVCLRFCDETLEKLKLKTASQTSYTTSKCIFHRRTYGARSKKTVLASLGVAMSAEGCGIAPLPDGSS